MSTTKTYKVSILKTTIEMSYKLQLNNLPLISRSHNNETWIKTKDLLARVVKNKLSELVNQILKEFIIMRHDISTELKYSIMKVL